jgi:hypothetical protein
MQNWAQRPTRLAPSILRQLKECQNVVDEIHKPKIELAAERNPTDIFDDLQALRKRSVLTVRRRPVLINIPVGKPPNNVYFRTFADPELILDNVTVICNVEGLKKTIYFVAPEMRGHRKLAPRLRIVTLMVTYTWPAGGILLWPVPGADRDVRCWHSEREAAALAQTCWVQMAWNDSRADYDVEPAENIDKEPTPPDMKMSSMLKIAFADRVIDNEEHPFVRRLRGIAD